ncbi:Hypothetical protein NTJ_12187 [Nesidiocoris tenuis]|uniref:DUF4190 domain-containing protein n=1 Tax=Nesidiocoris tenuis TaxID=355587 RepID=A0ABN7B4M7_9HEMI|nr:Hypothetical protein NTJ_12187 [Nesidiocoris tenuis]
MSRHGPYPASHHSRNPWNGGRSESVSSSASSQTYQNVPTNHYAQIDSQYQLLGGARCPQEMVGHLAEPAYLVPNPYPAAQPTRQHMFPPPTAESRRPRPVSSGAGTPISTGYVAAETAVLPCGGHCVALETFCHHLLQVVFVIGSLTGICLIVAGSAMKGSQAMSRGGVQGQDLGVLTYIGAMVSLVSGLLLAIQCCSRPRPSTRVRRHRQNHHSAHHQVHPRAEEIPLQQMGSTYLDGHPGVHLQHPAAATLKRQQTAPRVQENPDPYRGEGGIPWWRREEDAAV